MLRIFYDLPMHAIELKGLTKKYLIRGEEIAVVSNLSFSIKRGSVFGFLGPNGAGKTTTIKMLVGLTEPDLGSIRILEKVPHDLSLRQKIGFMPESPAFYVYLTAREFLQSMADLFGMAKQESKNRISDVLRKVDLSDFQDMQIRKFSKGMGQRLALAQALINDPEVLFLDEPLDGLDPFGRSEVKKILLGLKQEGKTIFFNSHILSDVEEICDEVGILDKGKLVALGSVQNIMRGFSNLEEAFVGAVTRFRAGSPATHS